MAGDCHGCVPPQLKTKHLCDIIKAWPHFVETRRDRAATIYYYCSLLCCEKSNRSSSVNGVAVKLPLVFLSRTIKVELCSIVVVVLRLQQ
jgi:hypothetical protein